MRVLTPMDFGIRILEAPSAEPMDLAQAKQHCRIPAAVTIFDDEFQRYIRSARGFIEGNYGLRLMKQKVEILFQQFPREDAFRLPIWPVQSVDYIKYVEASGSEHQLTVGDQTGSVDVLTRLYKKPVELVLPFAKIWPPVVLTTADAVRVGLTVGYITGQSPEGLPMPDELLDAIRLLVDHQYQNHSAITLGTLMKTDPLVLGVDACLASLRLYWM